MGVDDPREEYDDLLVDCEVITVSEVEFERRRSMEAFQAGWVVIGAVLDPGDRLLLVSDGDQWFLPGGSRQGDETLVETFRRELREEAGVVATPIRPHVVYDHRVTGPKETIEFTIVGYEATTQSRTGVIDGIDDDEIESAQFVDTLPENVYRKSLLKRFLRRVDTDHWNPPSPTGDVH